jgi:DMSO reductase anchor subunit
MNEIKLLFFVLVALMGSLLFWILDEPEIIEDKEIEIITTLGIGLLILIVDRKADHRINTVIHVQHELVKAIHDMLQEQNNMEPTLSLSLVCLANRHGQCVGSQ